MRSLIASVLLVFVAVQASAQQISPQLPVGNWARVQTISTGTSIHVNTATSHVLCVLKADDAETLTCAHHFQDLKFTRAEIKSIKVAHRTRSTWVAVGIALLGMGIATQIANHTAQDQLGTGIVVGLAGLLALIVSPIVGYFTDFTRSTVYQAN